MVPAPPPEKLGGIGGNGISGSRAAGPGPLVGDTLEIAGTSAMPPHCGHLAFLPALSSGVRNNLEQLGQRNSIGIATLVIHSRRCNAGDTDYGPASHSERCLSRTIRRQAPNMSSEHDIVFADESSLLGLAGTTRNLDDRAAMRTSPLFAGCRRGNSDAIVAIRADEFEFAWCGCFPVRRRIGV